MFNKKLVFALPVACSILLCLFVNLVYSGSGGAGLLALVAAVFVWVTAMVVTVVNFVSKNKSLGVLGVVLNIAGVPVFSVLLTIGLSFFVSPMHRERLVSNWNASIGSYGYQFEALKGNTLKSISSPIQLEHKESAPMTLVGDYSVRIFRVSPNFCQGALWTSDGKIAILNCHTNFSSELISVGLSPTLTILDRIDVPPGSQLKMVDDELLLFTKEQLLFLDPQNFSIREARAVPKSELLSAHPKSNIVVLPSERRRARVIDVKKREQVRFLTREELAADSKEQSSSQLGFELGNFRNGYFSLDGRHFKHGCFLFEVKGNDLVLVDSQYKKESSPIQFDPGARIPQESSSENGYKAADFESAGGFFSVKGKLLQYRESGEKYVAMRQFEPISLSEYGDFGVCIGSSRETVLITRAK